MSRCLMKGRWIVSHEGGTTLARHLDSCDEVQLRGELSTDLRGVERLRVALGDKAELLSDLVTAGGEPGRKPTLGDVLRGTGHHLLFLELTGRCNEHCMHCYADASPRNDRTLNRQQIARVLSQAKDLGFESVQLTGGDPLLSGELGFSIEEVRRVGIETCEVYTNGLAFNSELAGLFSKRNVKMAFSLYSHAPDVHDAVTRVPGSHERTCRAIRLAIQRGIEVRIGAVLGVLDQQQEQELRELVDGLGIEQAKLTFDVQRAVGRGTFTNAERKDQGEGGSHSVTEERSGKLCVTYEGNIVPCVFDRTTVLGHIDETSLMGCLETPLDVAPIPKMGLEVVGASLTCESCRFLHQILHQGRKNTSRGYTGRA